MSLKALLQGPLPVTAPLVLNPLMAKLAEAAGFQAGYLGGGSTGYQKVALEANLNLTEMCQAALDIGAVSSLPLIFDAACGFGDPMHLHRTIGMSEAAGFAAIEIEDQLLPKRAHHHIGIEHMIPLELMAAKVAESVAARRNPDFLIIARTNAIRASSMDDALRRGEAYRAAGADLLLLSSARRPEQLRTVAERLGGPLMYLTGRGGLAGLGLTLADLGNLGYRLVADPSTPLMAAYQAWKQVYADLADGFGASTPPTTDWAALEEDLFSTIGLERFLEVERRTVETGKN
jgi:methylisocitrate lyase